MAVRNNILKMTVCTRQFAFAHFFMWVIFAELPIVTEAVPERASSFLIRSWQTGQGLPNNTVNAITQTHDGYLWLGTDEGLARFDGMYCRTFGLKDGLDSLQISMLLEDRRGVLWIGTAGGGLSSYAGGEIKTYTVKDGLAGNSINALLEDTNEDIWVGTPTGLSCWRDGKFLPVPANLRSTFIFDLAKDHEGNIWIATMSKGVICLHSGEFYKVGLPATEYRNIAGRCLLVDDQDRVWVGSRSKYVTCFEQGTWQFYGTNRGMPSVVLNRLAQTPDGMVWAGSMNEGLYYFQDGQFHALRKDDGLSDDAILSLFVGRDRFLWVGTQAGGLCRIGPKKLSVYQVMQGDSECQLRSLAETTNGDLWVGTYGQGLFHQTGKEFVSCLPTFGSEASSHVLLEALLGVRDGSLWWGAGPVLYEEKDGKVLFSCVGEWLVGDRVWCLCENRNGGMWVGTFNGQLSLLKEGTFTPVDGLSGKPITALAQEPDGTLWVGSLGGGLSRLQNRKLTTFTAKDGLGSDLIRTLLLDKEGTLWIGTDGGGFSRWSHGKLSNFTSAQGLTDDTVLQILEDDDGNLWLGCNRGICYFNKGALEDVGIGKINALHPLIFGEPEGMPSEQCVGSFGAALKSSTGKLYFSTAKGIVVIDPLQQTNNPVAPTALLEDALIDGRPPTNFPDQIWDASAFENDKTLIGKIKGLQIPPGRHTFEFRYTGLSFDAPERVQFKYRLKGLDPDWIEADGAVRVAHYNYVPAGRYEFQVMAGNVNGKWNQSMATMPFVVLPHYWQNIWFKVIMLLMGLSLLAGGIRYIERRRYRARIKRLEQEQAMESERARIARDLHDELGSSLARISMLSDLGQLRDGSVEHFKKRVDKISNFAIRTARSLDEIVWAVNPRNDSLRSLLLYITQFSRELFEDASIRCRYQIPDDLPQTPLPPEVRHNLFLVVKEILCNTLKHAQASEVSLIAKIDSDQFKIIIQDDGVGFNSFSVQAKSERNGLLNMRQRIEAIGGQFVLETKPKGGTTVSLIIKNQTGIATGMKQKSG